tara:strand:+ start:220 stop:441 length:222 start_codon:yes stop_codon:yes gene_type:complete
MIKELSTLFNSVIVTIPIIVGIYEFRQFRCQLSDILKKFDEINKKLDDISKNKLENYPLLKDLKLLIDKINKF